MYTTLEPCFKRSKDKIPWLVAWLTARVGRVFIGMLDPDPSVHGKGQMFLLKNGISVQNFEADLTKEILELNRDFIQDRETSRFTITSHLNGWPFLRARCGQGAYKLETLKLGPLRGSHATGEVLLSPRAVHNLS